MLDMKNAPPKTLLRPTPPSPDLVKEIILENTSLAPLPRGRRVVPAMVGESFKAFDKHSTEGQNAAFTVCLFGKERFGGDGGGITVGLVKKSGGDVEGEEEEEGCVEEERDFLGMGFEDGIIHSQKMMEREEQNLWTVGNELHAF
ncbi:hypothetical protein F0562_015762 [Nyssa sinensis]|uniref:Uncharacterized protein n=1 Tax=Nyssa sinensis TaxID=561372 RepID=A0A5J4ZIE9_9ASTE|nr:hypothetical protein F0562_015762 [Nyssa sinensis]